MLLAEGGRRYRRLIKKRRGGRNIVDYLYQFGSVGEGRCDVGCVGDTFLTSIWNRRRTENEIQGARYRRLCGRGEKRTKTSWTGVFAWGKGWVEESMFGSGTGPHSSRMADIF